MTASTPGSNRLRNHRRLVGAVLVLLILLVLAFFYLPRFTAMAQYASYTRPDGRYQVLVMRKKSLFGAMPGQASDTPGVVRLYNQRGELLRETDVAMVQLVENVQWETKHLAIKLTAEWDLPD